MSLNVRHSNWYPYIDRVVMPNIPAAYVDSISATNPNYKAFIGGFVTEIEMFPTATGDLDTHYNVTAPLPFRFDKDFTLFINPFKKALKHTDGSAGTLGVIIRLQQKFKSTFGTTIQYDMLKLQDRWTDGILIQNTADNNTSDETMDATASRVVMDGDDVVHDSGWNTGEKFGININTNEEITGIESLGTTRSQEFRFAIGMTNNSGSSYALHADYNIFHLICVPHQTRRTPTS